MTSAQDEPVAESLLRIAYIPAHSSAQEQGERSMYLRSGAAWMAALSVVQDDVDELVDNIRRFLPMTKMPR